MSVAIFTLMYQPSDSVDHSFIVMTYLEVYRWAANFTHWLLDKVDTLFTVTTFMALSTISVIDSYWIVSIHNNLTS
jgi:late competence protein required for DNA uptake (superfamily II DNA/RNA helicase)